MVTFGNERCRFRFQSGTGGVREIKALREMSPAAFSVSIETGSTFFRFQLGLIYRLIDRPMNACRVRVLWSRFFEACRCGDLRCYRFKACERSRRPRMASPQKSSACSTSSPWKRLDRGRSKSATRMWRAGNPHLSERPFSPDGAEFLVSIGTGASFQSQLKPKNPRENPPVPH